METAENITSQEQPLIDMEVTSQTGPAPQEDVVADEAVERFLPRKARGELVPLVRFLKCASFREKLIAVALETLCSGDIEISIAQDFAESAACWSDGAADAAGAANEGIASKVSAVG